MAKAKITRKFKSIADEKFDAWKKSKELSEQLIKETSKVANSNYNLLTVVGRERTNQILKDYKDYVISTNKRQED